MITNEELTEQKNQIEIYRERGKKIINQRQLDWEKQLKELLGAAVEKIEEGITLCDEHHYLIHLSNGLILTAIDEESGEDALSIIKNNLSYKKLRLL